MIKYEERLDSAHPELHRLFTEVAKTYPCLIIEGHRSREVQDKAYAAGKSRLKWPNSRHNTMPSMAVDAAPYPLSWTDKPRFYHFAGFVQGTALRLGIAIRWGGDWDSDRDLSDNKLVDLVHFELL